jgi:hypothetical protein
MPDYATDEQVQRSNKESEVLLGDEFWLSSKRFLYFYRVSSHRVSEGA